MNEMQVASLFASQHNSGLFVVELVERGASGVYRVDLRALVETAEPRMHTWGFERASRWIAALKVAEIEERES